MHCTRDHLREITTTNARITSEGVAVGAEFIATHIHHSMDHEGINEWAREQGRNDKLIGTGSDLSDRVIGDTETELLIAAAMRSSNQPRDMHLVTESVMHFIKNLPEADYKSL